MLFPRLLLELAVLLARTSHAIDVIQQPQPDSQDQQQPILLRPDAGDHSARPPQSLNGTTHISSLLFQELEELARIVDITYCVGSTGVRKPFECLNRCADFPDFELVTTWNTGILLSDSCGLIALDHHTGGSSISPRPRLIVAFRVTYSIANTIADLSTIPQKYEPYPGDVEDEDTDKVAYTHMIRATGTNTSNDEDTSCSECQVHSGFLRSWKHTRSAILGDITSVAATYPDYDIHLVGHSLGGAVALLASLDLSARGFNVTTTTFGEPKVGNDAFVDHVDHRISAATGEGQEGISPAGSTVNEGRIKAYRRVTHADDPVPLLPPTEWGYLPHAGELFILKGSLPPDVNDVRVCKGDADRTCSASADEALLAHNGDDAKSADEAGPRDSGSKVTAEVESAYKKLFHQTINVNLIPTRYRFWQLFFAHRDYFHRLGLCIGFG